VLILSQHESPEMVRQAFKAGARGYVVKSSVAKDLSIALDTVSRHEPYFDPRVQSFRPDPAMLMRNRLIAITKTAALKMSPPSG
jgi:DNA-binding NarL/FixJ family response regulator